MWLNHVGGLEGDAVNRFRERTFVSLSRTIERIQAKIKREKPYLRGDHPFNPLQKSVDSPRQQKLPLHLDAQLIFSQTRIELSACKITPLSLFLS
jgi:hypothetical protein